MTKYLSRKIKFISLFLMIGVVFMHSYNYSDSFLTPSTSISEGFNFCAMLEYFISNGIARICVPMFFAISGYLFFRTFRPSLKCYSYKIKSRFFSLFIPYLIWCALSGIFLFLISLSDFSWLPIVQEKAGITQTTGLWGIINWFVQPASFQLWYIQQLMIFTVISPVIFWLIKYTRGIIIIPVAVLWIFDLSFIINSEAALFYMLGALIAIFDKESFVLQKESKLFTVIITLVWVAINIIKTILAAYDGNDNIVLYISKIGLTKISIIIGMISMWYLFDHLVKRLFTKKSLLLLSSHMFFIYTLHEPLLHICFQLGIGAGAPDPAHLALYICLPVSVIAFSVIVSMCVRKLCLPLHKVLTGNRSD